MRPLSLLFAIPLALTLTVAFAPTAEAVPLQLNHQGRLDDAAGVPLEGQHALKVSVYDQAAGGAELWSDTVNATFEAGVYSIILGANGSNPLPDGVFDGRVRYIALAVDDGPELPQRLVLTSVPYAMRAGVAASVAGGVVDASELRINGTTVIGSDGQVRAPVSYDDLINVPADADTLGDLSCVTGQIAQWNGIDWGCADQAPAQVDVSTLNGTVSITNLPVGGGADQVAAGDHAHSFSQITGVAAIGQLPTGTTGTTVALGDHGHNLVDLSGDLPLTRTTGDLPITRTTGDLPITRTTGDLPLTRTTGDLPITRTTGDLPLTRTTGDLALTRTTGNLDAARISGTLPLSQTSGSLDIATRTTGTVPVARLPVGTGSTEVAAGNHTHAASAITSGTLDAARLPTGVAGSWQAGGDLIAGGGVRLGAPSSATCGSAQAGTVRYTSNNLEFCNGTEWRLLGTVSAGADGGASGRAARNCKVLLADYPSTATGDYWIDPDGTGGQAPFLAFCDMTTNGGGWTLVANVAPADGNSVGYNNQSFWTSDSEYGNFTNKFITDYKSPAAYRLAGDQLLIASHTTANNPAGQLGWRRWPMSSPRTFDSMFSTGIVPVHGTDFCETANSDAVSVGTTNAWDDVIRQGSCIYTDVNPSSSGHADLMRLTTIPYNNQDNFMAGFASCIDCGEPWQGGADGGPLENMGIDRAGCNTTSCHYNQICRVPAADCVGNYCSGTYSGTSCGSGWNSRFFVR